MLQSKKKIRIFITDDHPLAVAGVMNMLRPYRDIQVAGTFHTGSALLEQLKTGQPDILLLDILLQDSNGKDIAATVSHAYPAVRIIALTSLDTPATVKAMFRNGCKGYLLKNTDQETMITAIRNVYLGQEFIEPSLKDKVFNETVFYKKVLTEQVPDRNGVQLTKREKDVLDLILQDNSNQEIAEKLFLSVRTVERHRFNLMRKVGAKSPLGLLKAAVELGLVLSPPSK